MTIGLSKIDRDSVGLTGSRQNIISVEISLRIVHNCLIEFLKRKAFGKILLLDTLCPCRNMWAINKKIYLFERKWG